MWEAAPGTAGSARATAAPASLRFQLAIIVADGTIDGTRYDVLPTSRCRRSDRKGAPALRVPACRALCPRSRSPPPTAPHVEADDYTLPPVDPVEWLRLGGRKVVGDEEVERLAELIATLEESTTSARSWPARCLGAPPHHTPRSPWPSPRNIRRCPRRHRAGVAARAAGRGDGSAPVLSMTAIGVLAPDLLTGFEDIGAAANWGSWSRWAPMGQGAWPPRRRVVSWIGSEPGGRSSSSSALATLAFVVFVVADRYWDLPCSRASPVPGRPRRSEPSDE